MLCVWMKHPNVEEPKMRERKIPMHADWSNDRGENGDRQKGRKERQQLKADGRGTKYQ